MKKTETKKSRTTVLLRLSLWSRDEVISAKRCLNCILGLMYSANLKLESQNLTLSVQRTLDREGGGVAYKIMGL
jgi:hypothetical protein